MTLKANHTMQTSPPSRGRANSDGRRASAHLSSPHLAMRSPLPRGGSSPNFGALETLAVPLLPPAYAPPELSPTLVWSYAVGHHYNDLCAACWFTYLLVYLEGPSIGLSETLAGAVMLAGQLADGLATPIVGLLSDRTGPECQIASLGLGRRKLWHAGGTALVLVNFGLVVFSGLQPFAGDDGATAAYLGTGAALFNVGWAAVQVSYLSLLPELHPGRVERTRLQAAAYASTVCANLVVFGLFFCGTRLWPDHPFQFVALLVTAIGLATTVLFHRVVREAGCGAPLAVAAPPPPAGATAAAAAPAADDDAPVGPAFWFAQPEYHWCCSVYMFTRLLSNLSLTYLAFFVRDALSLPTSALSTVPATLYLASFGATFVQPGLARRLSRAAVYSLGAAACAAACAGCMALPAAPDALVWAVYPLVVVLGWGSTTCMVTSVSSQADLIGARVSSGAFVYGSMSLLDKLSNGVAIFAIQAHRQALAEDAQRDFTRLVLVVGCGGSAVLGAACCWPLLHHRRLAHPRSRRPSHG